MSRPFARIAFAASMAACGFVAGALVVSRCARPAPPVTTPPPLPPVETRPAEPPRPTEPPSVAPPRADPAPLAATNTEVAATERPAPRSRLGGTVSSATSGAELEHVYVGLFRPASARDSAASEFGSWRGDRDLVPALRQLVTSTFTDERGAFRFDDLAAGTYVVRYDLGPLVAEMTAPQTLAPGEARDDLRLTFAPFGSVGGTLHVPAGAVADDLAVGLKRLDPSATPALYVNGRPDDVLLRRVARDGTYHLGPASPGRHLVILQRAEVERADAWASPIELGEVEIRAGEVLEREFDLVRAFPGTIRVRIEHSRLSQPWTRRLRYAYRHVVAEPVETAFPTRGAVDVVRGSAAVLGPLAAGTWRLTYRDESGAANWSAPDHVLVTPNGTIDVVMDVPLVAADVRFVDARTGMPITTSTLCVMNSDEDDGSCHYEWLDSYGRASMALVPGDYHVGIHDPFREEGFRAIGSLSWGENGPTSALVRLNALPITIR